MTKRKNIDKPDPVNEAIALFEPINGAFARLFRNRTQRAAVERLLARYGMEVVSRALIAAAWANRQPYAPTITTPIQLEDKWAALEAFLHKERAKRTKKTIVGL